MKKEGIDRVVCGVYFRSVKRGILKRSLTSAQQRYAKCVGFQRNFLTVSLESGSGLHMHPPFTLKFYTEERYM